mgnify:CR=1 FL=1
MTDLSLHLAPNAPWLALVLLTAALAVLGLWAYRFAVPPLRPAARRALPALRIAAFALLAWLLAQPVLERTARGGARLVVLLDRSRSMDLPAGRVPESGPGPARAQAAERVVEELRRAWRGRAAVDVIPFASRLEPDTARGARTGSALPRRRDATAPGDALASLALAPEGQQAGGVVVVSDGAVNAGEDPAAAARALGFPVHAVLVGEGPVRDRAVTEVESPGAAQVGRPVRVRARVVSTEERGTPMLVRLLDEGRELGRATVMAPGGGAETTAEFSVVPVRSGLAVWTARLDSLPGQITAANDARQIAVEVAPGRLGVLIVSAGLNWDLTFMRRALLGDSSLAVATFVRERSGWRALERGAAAAPTAAALRGQAVVVLDALAPADLGAELDAALAAFVRGGGGLMVLGGPAPGLARLGPGYPRAARVGAPAAGQSGSGGALGADLALALDPSLVGRPPGRVPVGAPTEGVSGAGPGSPEPVPEASELLAWDDDPARGERAWRAAAPLADLAPVRPGPGDRVLVGSAGGGPPLLFTRRIGRGQALLVNGTGVWRWSLSGADELTAERGRVLWRRLMRWLAEPVQGEPLRVRPERWLTSGGEPVRLFATLQDAAFRPVAGATVEGEIRDASGRAQRVSFEPRAAGSYVADLEELPAGRYGVSARATRGGAELGRSATEFAVDRWSLELARVEPDSAALAAMAAASGGRMTRADQVARWARGLPTRSLARGRTESLRLWESPWLFALVVGLLSLEWAWRRRRGLP